MSNDTDHRHKLFILDTNVLIHDPSSLFRFQEHDVYIPMIVLEELDHLKKGPSEVARNARQASRFLDELIHHADIQAINEGIPLPQLPYAARVDEKCSGRMFFQTTQMKSVLPESLPGGMPDNTILATGLALAKERPDTQVVLVSKDINMRIKASVLGIRTEDYYSDQVLDDINLLYSGVEELPQDFWEAHGKRMESWQDSRGRTFYKVSGPLVRNWHPNQFLYLNDESNFEAIVRSCDSQTATIELARDFRTPQHNVWGIQARNREQNFALNVLLDPEIDFVTLLGTAGTGKTLMTLAAGLTQTLDDKLYKEIIMTRETIPLGEDIGFLPGSEEEKMTPWMGALLDNLELLNGHGDGTSWERAATNNLLLNRVKVRSLNFMRGRTFLHRYIILDEAQNLTPKQMKTLITRAGPGTKIVCLGNIGQIDTPYLTGTTSGLTYVVDRFKPWPYGAHITLRRGERSRLADYAAESL
jgi:PhoH-like ATPase